MPIGTGIVYNTGDLILSQLSSSGTAFLETKIAAATSSLIYFDSTARINSASLNSITVGTASYVSGSNSIITNLTASNISASRTGSFGAVAIGTNNLQDSLTIGSSISESLLIQNNTYNNLSNGIQITSNLGFLNGASTNLNFARWTGTDVTDHATIGQSFNVSSWDLQFSSGRQNTGSAINYFTSSAVRMTIKAVTGNVGIGTTNPSGKLEIRTDAASTYIFSGSSSSGYTARFLIDDTALYIGHDSSVRSFTLRTNSTDRMTIAGGGNVGIGTISPAQSLDVSGSIRIRSAGTYSDPTDNAGFLNYDSIGGIFTISARSNSGNTFMAFRTSNGGSAGERMRIDNNGYVAINTTNTTPYSSLFPGQLVIDAGTGNVDGIFSSTNNINAAELILTKKNPTNNFGSLLIQHSGSAGDAIAVNYSVNTSTGGGGTNSFKVTTDGTGYFRSNVGIGTNSPLTRLHISNVSVNPVAGAIGGDSKLVISGVDGTIDLLSQDDNSTVSNVIGMGRYNSSTGALIHKFGIVTWANTGAAGSNTGDRFGFHYGTNADSYASTELLTIKSGGNVGIGSTNPSYKLDVVGPSTALSSQPGIVGRFTQDVDGRTLIRVVNSSISSGAAALQSGISFVTYSTSSNQPSTNTHEAQIILGSTGATSVSGGQTGTLQIVAPLDIAFNVSASNTIMTGSSYTTFGSNAMYLARSGNVGIGTTNPAFLLDVSGSSRFGFTSTNTHQFTGSVSLSGGLSLTNLTASNISASGTGSFGAVGIGISNPSTKLHITGSASEEVLRIESQATGESYPQVYIEGNKSGAAPALATQIQLVANIDFRGRGITFSNRNDSARWFAGVPYEGASYQIGYDSSNGRPHYKISSSLYIQDTGNVGIGTYNPQFLLDVVSTTTTPRLRIGNAGSNNGAQLILAGSNTTKNWVIANQQNFSGTLEFTQTTATGSSTVSTTPSMVINSSGNVGIGTSSPANKLDVLGNISASIISSSRYYSAVPASFVSSFSTTGSTSAPGFTFELGSISQSHQPRGFIQVNDYYNSFNNGQNLQLKSFSNGVNYGGWMLMSNWGGTMRIGATGSSAYNANELPPTYMEVGTATVSLVGLTLSGTASWATNATTAQTANALNTANNYTITNLTANNITASSISSSFAYLSNIGFSDQTVTPDTSIFPTGSTSGGFILDGGVYTNGLYRTRFVKIDRSANLSLYIQETKGSSGSFSNLVRFGTHANSPNTFEVFGSTNIQGSITSSNFVGSHIGNTTGTASWATNALTASFLPVGTYNITSSWAQNVVSASYATTAQTANALNASNTYTVAGLTSAYVDVTGAGTIPTTGIYRPSTKTLGLSADGTLIFKISNVSSPATSSIETGNFVVQSGNVGLGTNSPNNKLDIFGATGTTLNMSNVDDGNRGGKLTFISSSATGRQFYVGTNSSIYNLVFGIDSIEKMRLDTSGNLGIGTTAPTTRLHVSGSHVGGNGMSRFESSDYSIISLKAPGTGDGVVGYWGFRAQDKSDNDLMFYGYVYSSGFTGFRVDPGFSSTISKGFFIRSSDGNVGIGTSNPAAKLSVTGSGTGQMLVGDAGFGSGNYTGISVNGTLSTTAYNILSSPTDTNLYINRPSGNDIRFRENNQDQIVLLAGGNVGVGTSTPGAKLEISGSSNSALLNIKSPISGAIVYVSGSGAVGINTSNIGAYTLQVNGSFAATTKSFVIDHPTKAGKRLIYGSLESPYHGIRLTGRNTIKDGKCKVELPDYMYKLILHDSINIQLTGIKCNKTLYVDEINIPENYFTIAYDKGVFESYKDYEFFWDFTAIRADVPELNTEL